VLRSILARYLQCSPADISFGYTAHGKPVLDMPVICTSTYPTRKILPCMRVPGSGRWG
jgi:hypothetical protein